MPGRDTLIDSTTFYGLKSTIDPLVRRVLAIFFDVLLLTPSLACSERGTVTFSKSDSLFIDAVFVAALPCLFKYRLL